MTDIKSNNPHLTGGEKTQNIFSLKCWLDGDESHGFHVSNHLKQIQE